jgi:hypothetical protein
VLLTAKVRGHDGLCPACLKSSSRVHSRYRRTLTDAPVAGRPVRILLTVRRFFCENARCGSKTFVEQVDGLTRRWSRASEDLRRMLTAIGLALAGRAGARLSTTLGMPASRHRLLRLVRALPDPPTVTDRVVQAALKLAWSPFSRQNSVRALTGSGQTGVRPTRSPRFTCSVPRGIAGCWTPISRRASTARPRGPDGPGASAGEGQTRADAGESVPESRDHDRARRTERDHLRDTARRDPLTAAGQCCLVSARRATAVVWTPERINFWRPGGRSV